ncbi:MAG: DUF3164 family protein [Bacteroidetes bacterium]|nr:DUF3164 family protein [Bacteroidota bacterium]
MNYHQKQSDPFWEDETGNKIPTNRLTDLEKLSERVAVKLHKEAVKINEGLKKFKEEVIALCDQVYEASLEDTQTSGKNRKGNFTLFNFNRTLKIEVSISERIEFDDLTIQACKEKLDDFITSNTTGVDDFMRTLILSAFEKTSGSLDVKKVLTLRKYRDRTRSPLYKEAMDLLDKAIRRPDSKRYFRVFARNEEGKYELIDLNFSSI